MTSTVATEHGPIVRGPAETPRWTKVARHIGFWVLTMPVAAEMVAGGFWDLLRIPYVREVFAHLGYPLYLLFIIGIGKIPCAAALLSRGFPRLKEWAYAGAVFNYWGAMVSHIAIGDPTARWIQPLILLAFTLLSRVLLPTERTRPAARLRDWLGPAAILFGLGVFSLATLPQGSPPPPSAPISPRG